jgi:NADPH2:quinone reductase
MPELPKTPPKTMMVIAIKKPGGPDVLQPESRPVPLPGPHEVLIKVEAAGVNRPDVFQRLGGYPPPPGAPDYPGLEIAGTVCVAGPGATMHRPGARVCALIAGGGYAEYALAHETLALPVPGALTMLEAAALPETYFTVWSNVFDRGRLKPGDWFLVHGGSSGIGTTAIQLAKHFGAHVMTTAGSDAKCRACLDLGADIACNYKTEDFVEIARKAAPGMDLILDMVGGSYINRNYDAAAFDGRIVQIASLGGPRADVTIHKLMQKRLVHTGSTLRPRPVAEKAEIAEALLQHVWPLLLQGKVKPIIHATLPLREAAKAHAMMEQSDHIGKIMLET